MPARATASGIAPLRDDGTVRFAAIDLDEPDFGFAREVASFLPGTKWVERSRSGNAHVWTFFSEPVEGWIPRGIMRNALEALGRQEVEVFPKQDTLRPGMLGNYINLPYHGTNADATWRRPMVEMVYPGGPERMEANLDDAHGFILGAFLRFAHRRLNDPAEWRSRAAALGLQAPEDRPETAEFGTRDVPHACAMYIYEHRYTNPITPGNRAVVLFCLAKQFLNWKAISHRPRAGADAGGQRRRHRSRTRAGGPAHPGHRAQGTLHVHRLRRPADAGLRRP